MRGMACLAERAGTLCAPKPNTAAAHRACTLKCCGETNNTPCRRDCTLEVRWAKAAHNRLDGALR